MSTTLPPAPDGSRDPAALAGHTEHPPRTGFFTDTSVCIGCKACEVACKEWNLIPEDGLNLLGTSYDNTGELGASAWRHVAFIEQSAPVQVPDELDLAGRAAAAGAFFLLLDDPEVYRLPPDPVVTTRDLSSMWSTAAKAALALAGVAVVSFLGGRR